MYSFSFGFHFRSPSDSLPFLTAASAVPMTAWTGGHDREDVKENTRVTLIVHNFFSVVHCSPKVPVPVVVA